MKQEGDTVWAIRMGPLSPSEEERKASILAKPIQKDFFEKYAKEQQITKSKARSKWPALITRVHTMQQEESTQRMLQIQFFGDEQCEKWEVKSEEVWSFCLHFESYGRNRQYGNDCVPAGDSKEWKSSVEKCTNYELGRTGLKSNFTQLTRAHTHKIDDESKSEEEGCMNRWDERIKHVASMLPKLLEFDTVETFAAKRGYRAW